MKKTLFFILTVITFSCNSDSSPKQPDVLVGKWMIYKAVYENAVYEYEINGQCGSEALEMATNFFVTETSYSNADCTGFVSYTDRVWKKEGNGEYSIKEMGQTVVERTLLLTDNEIKVTEPGFITVIKYYKRV